MSNWFQRLCCRLTNHRLRKGIAWSVGIEPTEFHYRCLICGKRFWNYKPHRMYIKHLKRKDGAEE